MTVPRYPTPKLKRRIDAVIAGCKESGLRINNLSVEGNVIRVMFKPGDPIREVPVPKKVGSYIYAIWAENTDFVKIGYTTHVGNRMVSLKTASPHELVLIGLIEGPREIEGQIQKELIDDRKRGEWYRLTPKVLAKITSMGACDD